MKFLKKTIEYLFYLFVFTLPWQTKLILRPAATNYNEISLYFSYAILILTLFLFLVYKLKSKSGPRNDPRLWYLLAGLEIFIFISVFFAPDRALAWYYYLIILLGLALFYLLHRETKLSDYEHLYINKVKIIYVFLGSIFFQSILGIYQFLTQRSWVFKYLGLANHSPETLGSAVIETASGRWLRAYGGMDHPNIFGGVLVVALLISAYLLAKKKVINSRQQIIESLFLFIFYFISLFALFFTFSRSAWLALGVSFIILLVTFIKNRDRWVTERFIVLIIFSSILLTMAVVPYFSLVKTRLKAESRLEQQSIEKREEYLSQASVLLKNNFWLGTGIGNYSQTMALRDQKRQPAWAYQPVHNVFVLLTVESGIFSLLFFLGFLIYLIKRESHEGFSVAIFTALVILMLFDHWLLSLPFGIIFLFFVLGLI